MPDRPTVFSIPPGAAFLDVLANAVLTGEVVPFRYDPGDPLALADVTILLPTRRAVRELREVFIRHLGGSATILPDIRPIGGVTEEDHLLEPAFDLAADRLLLPEAIDPLHRRLALTRLIMAWGAAIRTSMTGQDGPTPVPTSASEATRLADDLARLMDDMEIAGIPWSACTNLAPEDHAGYFQITLDFLKIAFESWPAYLQESNLADPIERRDTLIRREAKRLRDFPPSGPVIAAGSTGSIPATRDLLQAIAQLPKGAVVLPGLDLDLDPEGFAAIGERDGAVSVFAHPQFGLKQLIAELGITRDEVALLGVAPQAVADRARILSEALRPAETTEHWIGFSPSAEGGPATESALSGVGLIEALNEQEEAVAIAIAIREGLEQGLDRIGVITPDRYIARRVAAELGRWGLAVDDSAGNRLDLTPEGVFARLLTEAVLDDDDPTRLLALLKHPLAAFGMEKARCRRAARVLEIAVFRGRKGNCGLGGLVQAIAEAREETTAKTARHIPKIRRRLRDFEWADAAFLAERLSDVLSSLKTLMTGSVLDLTEAATTLTSALTEGVREQKIEDSKAFSGPAGEQLMTLLDRLSEAAPLAMRPAEFPSFLGAILSDVTVNKPESSDPRVHIWGTLEARLQSADLVIMAGLDEGVWPAGTRTDPWLSRSMRAEIGLPPPEQRVGLAAHDFAQGFCHPRLLISRSQKRDGAPTVTSRWLQRLGALIGEDASGMMKARGQPYVELARDLDRWESQPQPVDRPEPKPGVALRPRRLSVTEIETLIRDPYAIYAKHVLGLEPLDPLDMAPDYALRGSLIHEALGEFSQSWTGDFDDRARAVLLEFGVRSLSSIEAWPDVQAIWSIRFQAIARWLVEWEAARAPSIAERHAEISGEMVLEGPEGDFVLRGRADRIDVMNDGRVAVIDFKTGTPPSARQVLVGFAPQLALEAAMVRKGAFGTDLTGKAIGDLSWIALGQVDRGRPVRSAVEDGETPDTVAERALEQLTTLVAAYDDPEQGYRSWARPLWIGRYENPYDHLARVREWALVASEDDLDAWQPPKP